MRFVYVIAAVATLTACSTAGPTAYRQAAPAYVPVAPPPAYTPGFAPGTPAAPVYTPAGAGLPGERVPGQTAPEVPRSPNRRVLPASSEQGLWAADGATIRSASPHPKILDVELPFPRAAANDRDKSLTEGCAAHMTHALNASMLKDRAESLSQNLRECLVARLFLGCAENLESQYRDLQRTREYFDLEVQAAVKMTKATAAEFVKAKCGEPALMHQTDDMVRETVEAHVRLSRPRSVDHD